MTGSTWPGVVDAQRLFAYQACAHLVCVLDLLDCQVAPWHACRRFVIVSDIQATAVCYWPHVRAYNIPARLNVVLWLFCCAYRGCVQRLVEAFESLMVSGGPGAPEADTRTFPRPVADERAAARAAQPPYDSGNCSPDNMRPTVMGVPNSTALRLR